MPDIKYANATELNWWWLSEKKNGQPHQAQVPDLRGKFVMGPRSGSDEPFKAPAQGDASAPSVGIFRYEPGYTEERHAHGNSEVLIVIGGSCKVGERELSPGGVLYVPGGTAYGPLEAGPEGLDFWRVELEIGGQAAHAIR